MNLAEAEKKTLMLASRFRAERSDVRNSGRDCSFRAAIRSTHIEEYISGKSFQR